MKKLLAAVIAGAFILSIAPVALADEEAPKADKADKKDKKAAPAAKKGHKKDKKDDAPKAEDKK